MKVQGSFPFIHHLLHFYYFLLNSLYYRRKELVIFYNISDSLLLAMAARDLDVLFFGCGFALFSRDACL